MSNTLTYKHSGALNFDTSLPVGVTADQVSAAAKAMPARKLLSMYICLASGHREAKPIGVVALSKPEERRAQHGSSFLSISIAARWQRQGYGKEAVAWALDWAFDFARLHRVEVSCYGWNPGAARLYASMGFCEEGVKREAIWFMGGWHNLYEMAILEHEWRERGRKASDAGTWAPVDGTGFTSEQIAEKMGSL